MLEELKIDPEFEKVIPPLTKDEYHQLEENILDDGRIMMPIAVWGDIIVDGHNRYRIAREYGDIPFSTTQLDLPTAMKPLLGYARINSADVI